MGYQEKTIGGGSATGLAQDFTGFLKSFINTGSFGGGTAGQQSINANPGKSTQDIFGLLNSLVSNPSSDASVQELISRDITRGRNDLRARFGASGGMGYGTPAAVAEGVYQAEQAPRTAVAMDEMAISRLGALLPLFQAITQLSALGTPQAQTVMEPKPWMQAVNLGLDVANTVGNFIPGGGGGATDRSSNTFSVPPINTNIPQWQPSWDISRGADRGFTSSLATGGVPRFIPLPVNQQLYR